MDQHARLLAGGPPRGHPARRQAHPASASHPVLRRARSSFTATAELREHLIYTPGILNGDGENFYGQIVSHAPVSETLTTSGLDTPSSAAPAVQVAIQGISSGAHSVQVAMNGEPLGTLTFDNQTLGVHAFTVPSTLLRPGANTLTLIPPGINGDLSLVQYVRLTYPASTTPSPTH